MGEETEASRENLTSRHSSHLRSAAWNIPPAGARTPLELTILTNDCPPVECVALRGDKASKECVWVGLRGPGPLRSRTEMNDALNNLNSRSRGSRFDPRYRTVTFVVSITVVPEVKTKTCNSPSTRLGATVAERLACSPPTKANRVQSPTGSLPGFSHVGIAPDDAAGWRVFSGISRPFTPALLHTHLTHPHRPPKSLHEPHDVLRAGWTPWEPRVQDQETRERVKCWHKLAHTGYTRVINESNYWTSTCTCETGRGTLTSHLLARSLGIHGLNVDVNKERESEALTWRRRRRRLTPARSTPGRAAAARGGVRRRLAGGVGGCGCGGRRAPRPPATGGACPRPRTSRHWRAAAGWGPAAGRATPVLRAADRGTCGAAGGAVAAAGAGSRASAPRSRKGEGQMRELISFPNSSLKMTGDRCPRSLSPPRVADEPGRRRFQITAGLTDVDLKYGEMMCNESTARHRTPNSYQLDIYQMNVRSLQFIGVCVKTELYAKVITMFADHG
ncbi:hypothetical protein PR048_000808 [Dryococelus australis]|uniref:Uncharacterized protein n=1 Tax=Dryococelus australis TaxID=614101 RepID=A0ABQ9IFM2_9NEOP|nr:hypothetical protein PR048_000808 [Dryococelus australis]